MQGLFESVWGNRLNSSKSFSEVIFSRIHVKNVLGEQITIDVNALDTVGSVKEKINRKWGVTVLALFYKDKTLGDDNESILKFDLPQDAVVMCFTTNFIFGLAAGCVGGWILFLYLVLFIKGLFDLLGFGGMVVGVVLGFGAFVVYSERQERERMMGAIRRGYYR